MLSGDVLSRWLQRRVGTTVAGSLAQLSPSGLLRVSTATDSHRVQVLLPVVHGGQAAVSRAVPDGQPGPELALRVQAVSSEQEKARQMDRLVAMLTVVEAARRDPAAYPAVLPVLESFVLAVPAAEIATAAERTGVTERGGEHELWCDVMTWCPRNLADLYREADAAARDPRAVLDLFVPVASTVRAVHDHLNVVHRDITPGNVLVDATGRLLLGDWGIAHTVDADRASTHTQMVGNRGFSLPPELLAGDNAVGRYTDAWYLGSLLVWMLTGQTPDPHGQLPPGMPGGPLGSQLAAVAQGLCRPDPHQRTSLPDALASLALLGPSAPEATAPLGATAPFGPGATEPVVVAGTVPWSVPGPVPSSAPSAQPGPPVPPLTGPAAQPWPVGTAGQGLQAPPPSPAPPHGAPRRRRTVTLLAGVLAVLLIVGLAGALWWVVRHPRSSAPTASTTGSSCWKDGVASGDCPQFAGAQALEYAYALPGRFTCTPADTSLADKMYYADDCAWPGGSVELQLFADVDAATAYWTPKADSTSTWKGDVGTVFHDDVWYDAYCYDAVPVCLKIDVDTTMPEVGTLSPDQVQRVTTWLADHPVADPTAGWNPATAEQAFPAAPGAEPLTCQKVDTYSPDGGDEQYRCGWLSDDQSDDHVTVTRWPSLQAAVQHYKGSYQGQEPWTVDGSRSGTVLTEYKDEVAADDDAVWCYTDVTYCIEIKDDSDFTPVDRIARIAPLTADQAAALGTP